MATMPDAAWMTARTAANRLVAGHADPDLVRGVLAQWIAENGWRWPAPRRNPGNLARGWAAAFQYPFTVELPNPQPGNPIVTFATAGGGASCYADGLRTFARYSTAIARAVHGDGLGFAVAVCRAGYGTRESTVRSAYTALGSEPGASQANATGGGNVAIRYASIRTTGSSMLLSEGTKLYDRPGGAVATKMARSSTVPHVGLAGTVNGAPWRGVVVSTHWSYSDGLMHRTVLYVPADAGKVVPA